MFYKILKMNHPYLIGLVIVNNERAVNKFETQCRRNKQLFNESALDMR